MECYYVIRHHLVVILFARCLLMCNICRVGFLRCKTLSLNDLHTSFRYRNLLRKIELIFFMYTKEYGE
jgi:hypothetical protein